MLRNMPERRLEPIEKLTTARPCPNCGNPEPGQLYFCGARIYSDIVGCDKCITVEYDLGEIEEILNDEIF